MKTYAFPLQLAREAIFLARYGDALKLLKPLSAAGDRDAQFLHSYLHFWDDDLPRTAAVELMQSAADHGHVEANYVLAVCPDLSPGYHFTLPTTEESMSRLRFAAEQGSVHAQTDLAQCYVVGAGVVQDTQQARELLQATYQQQIQDRRLSRHVLPKTCLLLARMLLDSSGGEQSVEDAMWALGQCQYQYGDPLSQRSNVVQHRDRI